MSEPSMIERMARAIAPDGWRDDVPRGPSRMIQRDALKAARAALAAIREPIEAMLEAVKPEPVHLYGKDGRDTEYQHLMKCAVEVDRLIARQNWETMIDAALANPLHPAEDRGESD